MTTTTLALNIEEFTLAVPSAKQSQKLDFALQSFAKRNFYAHVYFEDFMSASRFLGVERIDSSGNIRNKFEAYATAYVANIHAAIDSFPYVIYLVLKPLSFVKNGKTINITASNSNWNQGFFESLLKDYPKYKKLSNLYWSILKDDDFELLRNISNNHKHKYLTRIVNNAKRLRYEVIDYNSNTTSHVDVEKFFVRIHNKLLPKIFRLYQELQVCASR